MALDKQFWEHLMNMPVLFENNGSEIEVACAMLTFDKASNGTIDKWNYIDFIMNSRNLFNQ